MRFVAHVDYATRRDREQRDEGPRQEGVSCPFVHSITMCV